MLSDLRFMEEAATKLDLHLNHGGSELICGDISIDEAVPSAFPCLYIVSCSQVSLPVTLIGSGESIDDTIRKKIDLLKLIGDRLCSVHSQCALLVVHHSFAIPKVLYILQTAPCFLIITSNLR